MTSAATAVAPSSSAAAASLNDFDMARSEYGAAMADWTSDGDTGGPLAEDAAGVRRTTDSHVAVSSGGPLLLGLKIVVRALTAVWPLSLSSDLDDAQPPTLIDATAASTAFTMHAALSEAHTAMARQSCRPAAPLYGAIDRPAYPLLASDP